MELYLIRHGIAVERGEYSQDELRPLTEKGREKTIKVAKGFQELGVYFDLILTSPLVRAYQTAEILMDIGLSKNLKEFSELAPDGNLHNWLKWWQESDYDNSHNSIALVGHQPDLGNWAELLVWGEVKEKLIVKKAGVIGLNLPVNINAFGNSELFLLTSPKWIT